MIDPLLNLAFPPACLLCRAAMPDAREALCTACRGAMPRHPTPVSRARPLAFELVCAPFLFEGPAREAVHAFKYHNRHRVGRWLADCMADAASAALPVEEFACVTPVPPHWAKRLLKGFDPTALLARRIAARLRLPYVPALRRRRWTATQTRLNRTARFRNTRGAFIPVSGTILEKVPDTGAVLLVDDVLTSGATAHAGARALRDAGARTVYLLTAAAAPRL